MEAFILEALSSLPGGLDVLERESVSQGFGMIERLRRDWESGANRFDGAGEILLSAWQGGRLVGVGGLSRDPYLHDPRIGRVRHVYVLNQERRTGVGRAIVRRSLEHAVGHFVTVRLSTGHAQAFYDAIGFCRMDEPDATHGLRVR